MRPRLQQSAAAVGLAGDWTTRCLYFNTSGVARAWLGPASYLPSPLRRSPSGQSSLARLLLWLHCAYRIRCEESGGSSSSLWAHAETLAHHEARVLSARSTRGTLPRPTALFFF